jgi:hypothetical protein
MRALPEWGRRGRRDSVDAHMGGLGTVSCDVRLASCRLCDGSALAEFGTGVRRVLGGCDTRAGWRKERSYCRTRDWVVSRFIPDKCGRSTFWSCVYIVCIVPAYRGVHGVAAVLDALMPCSVLVYFATNSTPLGPERRLARVRLAAKHHPTQPAAGQTVPE